MLFPSLHPQPPQSVCWDSASQGENKDGISGHFCGICAQRTELKTRGTFLRIPPGQRTWNCFCLTFLKSMKKKQKSRKEVKNQRKFFYKTDSAGWKLLNPYRQCTCLYTGIIQHWKIHKRMDRNRSTEGTNTQTTSWRRELFNWRTTKTLMHLGIDSIPCFVKTTNRH